MVKVKSSYFCQNCGAQSSKWVGRCNSCGEWNTYVEEVIQREDKRSQSFVNSTKKSSRPKPVQEINIESLPRIVLPDAELNRVLGGGLVPGSIVLCGGEPGIGKSTLMLQIALSLNKKVLYVSGEESEQQIRMRAERVGIKNTQCYILAETSTQSIFQNIETTAPEIVIIDSIQTLHTAHIESTPGSISQIRECTGELLRFAKETNVPVILIGHITKDGSLAGPKVLEHMVDAVLQFEGDRNYVYRLLRANKNRFGSTNEMGIYEMVGSGLRQITNPSEILVTSRNTAVSGVAVAAMLEGIRPMLIEIQALVSSAAYGTPQRSTTGFDVRRLNMLLAVLEKRCGFRLGAKDVFLNIAGGIKVEDPGIDLAVVSAILSSGEDFPISPKIAFAAELGLTGEIRPVSRIEQRIGEAEKLGYTRIFISQYNLKGLDTAKFSIKVSPCSKIEEVFTELFG